MMTLLHQWMPDGPSITQFGCAVLGVVVISFFLTFQQKF